MKSKHPPTAKTLVHGKGSGEITDADVESRAHENAVLSDRRSTVPTAEDRQEARAEFQGEAVTPTLNDDGAASVALTRDPSEPPTVFEQPAVTTETEDEQENLERLALEGVDEASRDQMLAARKGIKRS